MTAQGTAAIKPRMPKSGSARRRAKARRNRQTVAALTCRLHGHVPHPSWDQLCGGCGEILTDGSSS